MDDRENDGGLAPKIKSTACHRCHSRKVKCSGDQPCANCNKSGLDCVYPSRNRRVRVDERYIKQLEGENKRLRAQLAHRVDITPSGGESSVSTPSPAQEEQALSRDRDLNGAAVPDSTSALHGSTDTQPWFLDIDLPQTPKPINEAADTAFATRFRQALSDPGDPHCSHVPHNEYAGDDTIMSLAETAWPWPKPSRARLLMNVALMHASRCLYIVRPGEVLQAMENSFSNPHWRDPIMAGKLRALFALGELCSSRFVPPGQVFPGLGHFAQATRILSYLGEHPTMDFIEIRLILSVYSFTLNRIYASYTFAGSAVRMAVILGLHLNIPPTQLPDPVLREHRVRVWWSAYILDRSWAAVLGCLPSIQDEDIKVDMPSNKLAEKGAPTNGDFSDAGYYIAYAKLARISMKVVQSIYGGKDQAADLFTKVQQRLKELKAWVEELPPALHMYTTSTTTSSYPNYDMLSLHLKLNGTIILATRPILLYGLRLHAGSSPPKPIPASAKTLIDTCIRCARHSYRILSESWMNGAFPALYHDLTQSLFSSLTVLAVSSLLDHEESSSDRESFEDAAQLMSQLKDSGNFPAREYYRHVKLMMETIKKTEEKNARAEMPGPSNHMPPYTGHGTPGHFGEPHGDERDHIADMSGLSEVTAETALAEPSLEEFLMQPAMGMQFLEDPSSSDLLFQQGGGIYWPEFHF
ncbi:fungal-specific transcription factor domain-containing protein [Triangularia setosa]|uniref:Fungal-specific transcription factor domain-containing protein n=1 Tax=Triangularia setosa TaxID=2587417 RepID=A0AAN6WEB2_9PEZI|nr:fungal-specific transcription factor domain-containing protein [Podospora setosa]